MTPDELKRLEEQTIAAWQARREDGTRPIQCSFDGIQWCDCVDGNIGWLSNFYRIKPTPKTVEAREWDAWIGPFGFLYTEDEASNLDECVKNGLKPIRVREVIDTPKERREWKAWVCDENGGMIEESDWHDVMPRDVEPHECGWRLATLVEKGGWE